MNKESLSQDMNNINTLHHNFIKHLSDQGKTANTLKNYKNDIEGLKHLLFPKKDDKQEVASSPKEIEAISHYIFTHYPRDNSRRRKIQTLRIFFDYLLNEGLLKENPLRKLPTAPKSLEIPHPPSFDQLVLLWQHLMNLRCLDIQSSSDAVTKILNARNILIFLLIYKSCLKAQDLELLMKSHLMISGPKARHRILINPKKREAYSVPLPSCFSFFYSEYDGLMKKHFKEEYSLNEALLVTANHFKIIPKGISIRGIEMVFEDLRKKVKLVSSFNAKTLRQAGIFCWLHEGFSENLIKEWLGVAPSYSLSPYSDHKWNNIYQDHFLQTSFLGTSSKNEVLKNEMSDSLDSFQ